MTLQWSGVETLQVWIDGQSFEAPPGTREVTADFVVGTGETLVLVGRPRQDTVADYINFNVVVRQ